MFCLLKRLLALIISATLFFNTIIYISEKVYGMMSTCPPEPIPSASDPIIARAAHADTYAATDALGRTLPDNAEAGDVREDKFVGLFYWTWHVSHAKTWTNAGMLPKNVQKIVEENPDAVHDLDFEGWGPEYYPHHWNEPLYGFYDTDDRWVLRRHAELLANAGVDVIVFDNTNGTATWKESYDVLFEVFSEARKDGVNTPKIAFMLPFFDMESARTQLQMLYDDVYSAGRASDLWFYWQGRPLILVSKDVLDKEDAKEREMLNFFTFRYCEPSYNAKPKTGSWGWLSTYPQTVYRTWYGKAEQTTVGVAMNHSAEMGLTAMNGENIFGRTYTSKGVDKRENAKRLGANFQEQWEYALKVDPEFVFITGWNEWVAGRFPEWQGVVNAFPDEYNDEFSRDIEPSAGDLGDDYYYQMCKYIRLFKGVGKPLAASEKKTIDLDSDVSQWDDVAPVYYAYPGNTFDRDDVGYGGVRYTDSTGRNDITEARVARDDDNVYFTVRCADDISPLTDPRWMRLLIDTDDSEKNWEGCEFIVNRSSPGEKALLERSDGGWSWASVCEIDYSINGDTLTLSIPRSALGLGAGDFRLGFKWTDNTLGDGDIMDFYTHGDTTPAGRFFYVYEG